MGQSKDKHSGTSAGPSSLNVMTALKNPHAHRQREELIFS
ncbi:hypothetical protein QOZ98_000970 [Planomicrobium stackebrandtii]|uniref:Uncharacterized protein n=1 Tax=Planomicrobium stackebrandtii TaxID=253160 RepID=A0ABU0GS09_9BACL|nr:hypothetical protein [Planomicrobium stackebrandtii]